MASSGQQMIAGIGKIPAMDYTVKHTLLDLAKRDSSNKATNFAKIIVRELGDDAKLLRNTHRFAGFVVLTGLDIPSVLLELGYLSNRYEANLLAKSYHRDKLATGILRAIEEYF